VSCVEEGKPRRASSVVVRDTGFDVTDLRTEQGLEVGTA
jgi:hypothetical protein